MPGPFSPGLEVLGLVATTLLTRLPFMAVPSSDTWHHLWLIRFYRESGSLHNRDVAHSVEPGFLAYPPIPHILIARLPEKWWHEAGSAISMLAELGSMLIVYAAAVAVQHAGHEVQPVFGLSPAAAVTLIWITAPILHPTTARLRGIGGRVLGNFLLLLYAGFCYAAVTDGAWWPLLPGACCAVFVVLSSQFAMQVMLVVTVAISAAFLNVVPLLMLLVVVLLAVPLRWLALDKQLLGKLQHYQFYLSMIADRKYDTPGNLATAASRFAAALRHPVELLAFLVRGVSPVVLLINMPVLILVMALCIRSAELREVLWSTPVSRFMLVICSATLVASVLTMFEPLTVFGSPERYMEYAMPAFVLLLAAMLMQGAVETPVYLGLLAANCALVGVNLAFLLVARRGVRRAGGDADLQGVATYLDGLPRRRIATVPTKLASIVDYYCYGRHDWFHYPKVFSPERGIKYGLELEVAFNYIDPDLRKLVDRYGIDTLVVSKAELAAYEKRFGPLRGIPFRTEFDNAGFDILQLSPGLSTD